MFVSIFVFALILWVLVIVHEWGHFWVARKFDIFVEEFGFGLPPKLWGKKKGETEYTLNALPIGGFVRLYGEDAADTQGYMVDGKKIPVRRAFFKKSPWVRAAVVVAGVVMNFILAVVVFSVVYSVTGIPEPGDRVQVVGIQADSPAANSGLMLGDIVVSMQGPVDSEELLQTEGLYQSVDVHSVNEFVDLMSANKGKYFKVLVSRQENATDFSEATVIMHPRENPPEGEGPLGVIVTQEVVPMFYPWYEMPVRGAVEGLREAANWSMLILNMFGTMIHDAIGGTVPEGVAGPIGIYQLTDEVRQFGWAATLRFLGILSVNLAVVNMLPIPALDGGRLWFLIFEGLTGKRVPMAAERWLHGVGMTLLLGLLLIVTVGDVARIFQFNIGEFLKGLI